MSGNVFEQYDKYYKSVITRHKADCQMENQNQQQPLLMGYDGQGPHFPVRGGQMPQTAWSAAEADVYRQPAMVQYPPAAMARPDGRPSPLQMGGPEQQQNQAKANCYPSGYQGSQCGPCSSCNKASAAEQQQQQQQNCDGKDCNGAWRADGGGAAPAAAAPVRLPLGAKEPFVVGPTTYQYFYDRPLS